MTLELIHRWAGVIAMGLGALAVLLCWPKYLGTQMQSAWDSALKAAPMRTWAMVLAAPPLTGVLAWIIWIIAFGNWTLHIEAGRLYSLANIAYGLLFLLALVMAALTGVSFAAAISKGGLNLDVGDHPETAVVKTTTTTEVTPSV